MSVSQSTTIGIYLKMLVYTMVYSGPTSLVSLPATENVVISARPTTCTGENHRVNHDLKNVRLNKEMGS